MSAFRHTEIRNVTRGDNVVIYEPSNLYDCTLGNNVFVGPFVEIQGNSWIGDNSKIQSHTFICEYVTIGSHCFIGHGVMFANDMFREENLMPTAITGDELRLAIMSPSAAGPRFWPCRFATAW